MSQRTAPASQRTTLALTGTSSKAHTFLHFEGELVLKYASLWLTNAGSPRPPASGILRRALAVYSEHLRTADEASEVRAVRRACSVLPTQPDAQQMALLRLYGFAPGERLPAFKDILTSPVEARKLAELTDRADLVAAECIAALPCRRQPRAAA